MTPEGSDRLFDPGVQLERTQLAWDRTGLAMLVNAGLVFKLAADRSSVVAIGLGLLVTAVTLTVCFRGVRTYRRRNARLVRGASIVRTSHARAAWIAAVTIAAVELLLAFSIAVQ